jgi:hypothetical protein
VGVKNFVNEFGLVRLFYKQEKSFISVDPTQNNKKNLTHNIKKILFIIFVTTQNLHITKANQNGKPKKIKFHKFISDKVQTANSSMSHI